MSKRTIAIVQARMGSTRFPGKMTALFNGAPILSWVIQRLQASEALAGIVLATTNLDHDKVLIDIANDHGIETFAGDEQNVLSRFVGAARQSSAELVVRVCADNPLVSPEAIDQLVHFYIDRQPDYAFNHVPKGDCKHPDGFGAEILSAELLGDIHRMTSKPQHIEHVTSYIWDHPDRYDIQCPDCPTDWLADGDARFDVDHAADLARLEAMLPGITVHSSIRDVLQTWQNSQQELRVQ